MDVWKNAGSSSSPGMHIQYATCDRYPGVQRLTARYTAEPDLVEYVVSGRERAYKTPERAAWAAVAAGVAPAPLRTGPPTPGAFLGVIERLPPEAGPAAESSGDNEEPWGESGSAF